MDVTNGPGKEAQSGGASPGASAGQVDGAASDLYDVTIIGAGPTGLFGAFYAGMRTMKTKIIDALEEPGGQLSALYPEKYIYDAPGFPRIVAKDLVSQLLEQALQWNPALCLGERVLSLQQGEDGHWILTTDKGRHHSRSVVIAAGVGAFSPNRIPVPGVEKFEGEGLFYFVKDKLQFQGKDLLIVGGGDSAVDWALNLFDVARSITLIHRRDEFRAHESSVNEMRSLPIEILTPYEVRTINGKGGIDSVVVYNNKTQEERELKVDYVLANLGFKADIGPIREWGLTLEKRGIVVNNRMETNLPGVYGAGDIVVEEVKMNLIANAYSQAAIAVNVAKHYIDPKAGIFPGHSSEKM
ncbi:MAG TPA: NAD(P)/FAD-dependent oxidoreductase [Chloroflexia bacterium]|nr:NAD(P)/FAD-dependent oxidoreductase [Chloroflexia bacterium]